MVRGASAFSQKAMKLESPAAGKNEYALNRIESLRIQPASRLGKRLYSLRYMRLTFC
jgi:hypothetical protein